jgi:heme-degrading monooxygenase HmoA
MAFSAMNVVRAAADEVALMAAEVSVSGFDALRGQPGFRMARLYLSEEGDEAVMITEWDSRDAFLAYRQSEAGRRAVERAMQWHPKISFYQISAEARSEK